MLSRRRQREVLALLVASHLGASLAVLHALSVGSWNPWEYVYIALGIAQAGLLGQYFSLGPGSLVFRGLASAIVAYPLVFVALSGPTTYGELVVEFFVLAFAFAAASLMTLRVGRGGVRISRSREAAAVRWTIGRLMSMTAAIAIVLASCRWRAELRSYGNGFYELLGLELTASLVSMASVLAAFGRRWAVLKVISVIVFGFAAGAATSWLTEFDDVFAWPTVLGGPALVQGTTLLIVRAIGYRLVRARTAMLHSHDAATIGDA